MKGVINNFILFIVLNLCTWIAPQKASAQASVNFQVFYDDLSPYGYWVDNSDYGYVWVPNVSPGFTPYGTNGYWLFTDVGWTWVSNYPWGWAPFHYGRWYSDPIYGPMWVPGNEWGPGWVTWRRSEGYYGWAPIEPGISINIAYSNGYSVPNDRWTFVRERDFGRTNINNYYVNSSSNTTIINNSTVINNIQEDNSRNVKYNAGPDRTEVQRRTGTSIAPVSIRESSKPGQSLSNGGLQIYRPRVEKNNAVGQKPAPSKVASLKDVKPAAKRNAETQPQKENQINKEQPSLQQRNNKLNKEQPSHSQPGDQPAIQEPSQKQRNSQPNKEQPSPGQPGDQPAIQQPSQQQHNMQPNKEKPIQRQRNGQSIEPPPTNQPPNDQPKRPQPSQPQHPGRTIKHQPSQQKQPDPPQNKKEEKQPH